MVNSALLCRFSNRKMKVQSKVRLHRLAQLGYSNEFILLGCKFLGILKSEFV